MENNIKDKVVVVTGGASGIGYEIVDKFLENGAKITIILDISEPEGNEAVKKLTSKYGDGRVAFFKCDVTKDLEQIFKKVLETSKCVNVLVNSAGVLEETNVKKTIDINVTALIEWSMKFWEYMRKDKGGKGGTILNLASIYGFRVEPYVPVYHASKFAVMGFTKCMGHKYNYERSGVRVIALCPGITKTPMTDKPMSWNDNKVEKDFSEHMKSEVWQTVDAVGKAAVDVFEKAESGTAWVIEGARPVSQVP